MNKIIEFIKKTPKAELHLHIEGTLEPDLLFKLAKRNDIQIPFANVDEIKSAYNFKNLESFLNIYYQGSKVLVKDSQNRVRCISVYTRHIEFIDPIINKMFDELLWDSKTFPEIFVHSSSPKYI